MLGKELARLDGRPKAQVDRTAHGLRQSGILTRTRALESHDWIYQVSTVDDAAGMQLRRELDRREAVLLEGLSPSATEGIVSVLQKIFAEVASVVPTAPDVLPITGRAPFKRP